MCQLKACTLAWVIDIKPNIRQPNPPEWTKWSCAGGEQLLFLSKHINASVNWLYVIMSKHPATDCPACVAAVQQAWLYLLQCVRRSTSWGEQLHWHGLRYTSMLMDALPIKTHLEQVLTRWKWVRVCVWVDVCALIANVSSRVLITCDAVQQEKQPVSDNHCCHVQKSLNLNYSM